MSEYTNEHQPLAVHLLVWYGSGAVRFRIVPRSARERFTDRAMRLLPQMLREAREALGVPAGARLLGGGDALVSTGRDPLPLPDGVSEVWL